MLKHGLIADKIHWNELTQLPKPDSESVIPHIQTSMDIKQEVVNKDFQEKNIRKTLNFGHTIGHAVESLCLEQGNPVLHGEAVAAGMICETHLSYLEGLISEEESGIIIDALKKYYPYLDISDFSDDAVFALLFNDKKNTDRKINFSLLTSIGSCNFDYQCSEKMIRKALKFYREINTI
ncbi:UNVERIFIED_CONTAM: 3-dehydroquinate synthetase [Pseudacidovorax intermedius]|nr:3-dehydroquinate synthetase [Pseudacidovorax intermedius]